MKVLSSTHTLNMRGLSMQHQLHTVGSITKLLLLLLLLLLRRVTGFPVDKLRPSKNNHLAHVLRVVFRILLDRVAL